ncbi:putative ribonuclease H-like domain-containing protein, partial [Tanacetum coccineum]
NLLECPLTILNTLDSLGKFDGKSDEGYLLGYSTSSKAFRVYNKRTKRVQENLHINFLEDQPNVAGTGPNWMFDLDFLTNSMNYVPIKEKRRIASQKKAAQTTSTNQLSIDRPSVSTDRPFVSIDRSFVSTDRSNTPNVSAASTSTGANADESSFVYLGGKIPIDASTLPNSDLPIDLNMPVLEDASNTLPNDGIFNRDYDDDEDVGAEADFNNMDNTIVNRTNHKDHQNCLFACFLSQEEHKTISQALQDESWVEAMQEELLLFKLQKVWVPVDLPYGKKVIGTKWVFRNKRDKRSIVVKNKARLVAQGFRQEEGIDYDEVFAPIARIEAIKLFLAFASYMGFTVYQMDIKSAFLYGTIEEDVYVHQPPGFVDPAYLTQKEDKYVADILKKFDFLSIRIATTLIESNKPPVKDEDGVDVDVHVYRSMISSLMYLTASRLDIMFAVCTYARFQVTPKALHLNTIKRIFRYLKQQPKLGLWYPRDSPFELEAYSDSEYVGASLDKKSTTDLLTKEFDVTRISMDLRMDKSWAANSSYSWSVHLSDSTEYTITEASVRSKLQLADATGIHNLSNAEIFAGLATLRCSYGSRSYEAPLPEGNTSGSAEDSMQLKELMDIVPKLVTRIETLETELQQTKTTYGKDIDDDPLVSLVRESMKMKEKLTDFVTPIKASGEAQEEDGKRYRRRARSVAKNINTGLDAEEEINTSREEINIGIEEISTGSTKVDSGTASKRGQREGKAPMVEEDI